MSTVQQVWPVYALLTDESTVEIRPAEPRDFDAVKAMHEAMSPDNACFRFFGLSRGAEAEARRICREPEPGRVALLALAGGEVVGCASYETLWGQPDHKVEVAFAVADHMHHKGVATLLLEHMVFYARSHQITAFTGQTLAENTAMLKGLRRCRPAGAPSHRGRGHRHDHPAAQGRRGHRPERLPERGGRAGASRGCRQPAARVRT
jgi:GNAT superfamily N-acetyltransferase